MQTALTSVADALERMLAAMQPPGGIRQLSLAKARTRVLAQSIRSPVAVPPADNSAMDGYALRVADLAGGDGRLRVSQYLPAGNLAQPLAPGTAARIFTGGMLPPGADAVIAQEDARPSGEEVEFAIVPQPAGIYGGVARIFPKARWSWKPVAG